MGHVRSSLRPMLQLAIAISVVAAMLGGVSHAQDQDTEADFEKSVLDDETENPMELEIAPDGRVFYTEIDGVLKVYDPEADETEVVGEIDVHRGNENGLLGIALDPNFDNNGWLYLFYSAPEPDVQHVSRFTFDGGTLDLGSEEVLLEIPHQREVCCHSGGSMVFDREGNLYISTGDDAAHFASDGYSPIDGRVLEGWDDDEYESEDAQRAHDARRTSGSTNDLRGSVLRITPTDDGSYTIPEDNLFSPGMNDELFPDGEYDPDLVREEIYAMGFRNPIRLSIDLETGWLYVGDVGPDAGDTDPDRGPRGLDEFNQVREAGNFGWPYCIGENEAYVEWDFEAEESGEAFDCEGGPTNDSPFNTGLEQLPPAEPAMIWYPYDEHEDFPEVPHGPGRAAFSGAVYHHDADSAEDGAFPASYDGEVFVMDWSRYWLGQIVIDDDGDYAGFEQFMAEEEFLRPHDMAFGPDGHMYLIEWGDEFNYAAEGVNPDSGLYRISYVGDDDDPADPQGVCERHQDGATFPDAEGSGHQATIDCLAELEIAEGLPDGTFEPQGTVSREQLASFVVRAVELADDESLPVGDGSFPDVEPSSTHGEAVAKLHEAGVIEGYTDGTFGPTDSVSREQTARFISGALVLVRGEPLPTSGVPFDDVAAGSQFAADIDRLATADLIHGFDDGTFAPRQPVTRAQMTKFVANSLELLDDEGLYAGP